MSFSFARLKNELNRDEDHFFVCERDFVQKGFIIYGAGFHTKNCLLPALKTFGFQPEFIVDSDNRKWGSFISGIEVKSPDALYSISGQYVIVSGTQMRAMILECIKRKVSNWIVPSAIKHFCWSVAELGCSFDALCKIEKDAGDIFRHLEDELSRKIFFDVFSFMSLNDTDLGKYCEKPQYFSSSLVHLIDYKNFVDIGMFSGDTFEDLATYAQDSKKFTYYGVDCIHENIETVKRKAEKYDFANIHLFEFAASSHSGKVLFLKENAGGSSTEVAAPIKNGGLIEVDARAIDSLDLPLVSVIKADIEGAEMEMLKGCVQTIRKYRPTLIISAYHRFYDMISIPSFILQLGLGYKIFFRHHSAHHADTVCYAIA